MNAEKQKTSKRAWADMTARALEAEAEARQKTKFAKIACIGLQIHAGLLTRTQAAEQLNKLGVTREDIQGFRQWQRSSN